MTARRPRLVVMALLVLAPAWAAFSAEETAADTLVRLRQVVERPAVLPEIDYPSAAGLRMQQLDVALTELQQFLSLAPAAPARHQALVLKLHAMFELLTLRGQGLARLREECEAILKSDPSPELAAEAEYWLHRLSGLEAGAVLAPAERLAALRAYVEAHPRSATAAIVSAEAVRVAETAGDFAAVDRWLARLRAHHPADLNTSAALARDRVRQAVGADWSPGLLTLDGQPVDWGALRGRPVLVVVWASWHVRSAAVMRELGASDAAIVGVSLDQDAAALRVLASGRPGGVIHCCDGLGWAGRFVTDWGVTSLPTVIGVDAAGRLAVMLDGHGDEVLRRAQDWLSPTRPVATSRSSR